MLLPTCTPLRTILPDRQVLSRRRRTQESSPLLKSRLEQELKCSGQVRKKSSYRCLATISSVPPIPFRLVKRSCRFGAFALEWGNFFWANTTTSYELVKVSFKAELGIIYYFAASRLSVGWFLRSNQREEVVQSPAVSLPSYHICLIYAKGKQK